MKRLTVSCALALLVSLTGAADADLILQDQYDWAFQIMHHSPIGQSFAAENPTVTIGFWVSDWNQHAGPINLEIELFEGAGTGGTSLAIAPIEGLTAGYDGFFDADFTSVVLVPGRTYTAKLSSESERGAVYAMQDDLYAGGEFLNTGSFRPEFDAAFRVTPVPVPGAVMLGMIGLGAAVMKFRNRA